MKDKIKILLVKMIHKELQSKISTMLIILLKKMQKHKSMRKKKNLLQAQIKTKLQIKLNKPQNNLKKMVIWKILKQLCHKNKKDMFLRVKKLPKTLHNHLVNSKMLNQNEQDSITLNKNIKDQKKIWPKIELYEN